MNIYDDAPQIIIIPFAVNTPGTYLAVSSPRGHNGLNDDFGSSSQICRIMQQSRDVFPSALRARIYLHACFKDRAKLFLPAGKSPESRLPRKSIARILQYIDEEA